MTLKTYPVSIVVASHKGVNSLPIFIRSIYKSSFIPSEIIICCTNKKDVSEVVDPANLVKVVISPRANQVTQRLLALNHVSNEIVIQTDDDVTFQKNTIELFFKKITNSENDCIFGANCELSNSKDSHRLASLYEGNALVRFVINLLNSFKEVKSFSLLKSGRVISRLPCDKNKNIFDTEWLDSIICYRKEILNISNFLPSVGKSYFEDVFFSHNLYLKGFKLSVISNAKYSESQNIRVGYKEYLHTIEWQYFIVRKFNLNYLLFVLDIVLTQVFYLRLYLVKLVLRIFKLNSKPR